MVLFGGDKGDRTRRGPQGPRGLKFREVALHGENTEVAVRKDRED